MDHGSGEPMEPDRTARIMAPEYIQRREMTLE